MSFYLKNFIEANLFEGIFLGAEKNEQENY